MQGQAGQAHKIAAAGTKEGKRHAQNFSAGKRIGHRRPRARAEASGLEPNRCAAYSTGVPAEPDQKGPAARISHANRTVRCRRALFAQSNCLAFIPDELISGYATAKYFLLAIEWELSELDPAEWDCSQPMRVMRENEQVAWSSIAAILRNDSDFQAEPPNDEQLKMRVPATAET